MAARCKTCGTRTTASAGYCQRCKSLRHHGYKRLKEENLLLDEAGGAWWIWNPRGDVLVSGKPTAAAAVIALAEGNEDEDHSTKKTPAQLNREITAVLTGHEPVFDDFFYLTDTKEQPLGPEFPSRLAAKRAAMKLVREGSLPRIEVWHRWQGARYMQGIADNEGWSDV
jgi:hypothetical protein